MYSLGYADGRDFGISPLGDAVEPYGPLQETFGALHAMGQTRSLSLGLSLSVPLVSLSMSLAFTLLPDLKGTI